MDTRPLFFLITSLGRQGLRQALRYYDGIACFIDKSDESFQYSKEELDSVLSDDDITQPIVILVPTPNASGYANDPDLISEFELGAWFRGGIRAEMENKDIGKIQPPRFPPGMNAIKDTSSNRKCKAASTLFSAKHLRNI